MGSSWVFVVVRKETPRHTGGSQAVCAKYELRVSQEGTRKRLSARAQESPGSFHSGRCLAGRESFGQMALSCRHSRDGPRWSCSLSWKGHQSLLAAGVLDTVSGLHPRTQTGRLACLRRSQGRPQPWRLVACRS